jgi:hypothetical protein
MYCSSFGDGELITKRDSSLVKEPSAHSYLTSYLTSCIVELRFRYDEVAATGGESPL